MVMLVPALPMHDSTVVTRSARQPIALLHNSIIQPFLSTIFLVAAHTRPRSLASHSAGSDLLLSCTGTLDDVDGLTRHELLLLFLSSDSDFELGLLFHRTVIFSYISYFLRVLPAGREVRASQHGLTRCTSVIRAALDLECRSS